MVSSNMQRKYKEKKNLNVSEASELVAGRKMVSLMEVKVQQEKLINNKGKMAGSVSSTSRNQIEIHMEMSSR